MFWRSPGVMVLAIALLGAVAPLAATPTVQAVDSGSTAATAVSQHGSLRVAGNDLVGEHGEPVQLRGISSHGLNHYPEFVNRDAMETLVQDWGITVFRAAMYTGDGGYVQAPEQAKADVARAVEAAVDLGIYVIVDWHTLAEQDPNAYRGQALEFFDQMAREYAGVPNVIWEIANEPNGDWVTWGGQVKPYAEAVLGTIRQHDPAKPVIVGSPTWSQDIHLATADPLADPQVLYSLHFYAGTHGAELMDRIDLARERGFAVFVSEWGPSRADGDGGVYEQQSRDWVEFLAERDIGWAVWNLSDKQESSAVLRSGADHDGDWAADDLTPAGVLVRDLLR